MNLFAMMLAIVATTMPIPVTDAPLDRVLPNLESRVVENPEDPNAHYALGRAHALAYATKLDSIRGYKWNNGFRPLGPDMRDWRTADEPVKGSPIPAEELPSHLTTAVHHLAEAIRLERKPRYYLALGAVLETAGESRIEMCPELVLPRDTWREGAVDDNVDAIPKQAAISVARARVLGNTFDPALRSGMLESTLSALWSARDSATGDRLRVIEEILSDFWREQTADAYFVAFSLALAEEAKVDDRPMGGSGLRISLEAGESFLRVSDNDRDRGSESARRAIAQAAVDELSKQHMSGGITPIIFPLHGGESLAALIDHDASVHFDLDGTGLPQSWNWVNPNARILVWDPDRTGKVESGRQLFGSVTWWVMFEDGYRALDALDDNRDGTLTGEELEGIAVWTDADGDGVSDEDEVTPATALGITGIETTFTEVEDGCPANPQGIRLRDGRWLPSYDWIATRRPASNPSEMPR